MATSIAVELVTAGAEELAAEWIGAGVNFEEGVRGVFVGFDRKALEKRVAIGAGGRSESRLHDVIIAILRKIVKKIF